ncbi:hypothetical protein Tco_0303705 [Tanacetum coccineum]
MLPPFRFKNNNSSGLGEIEPVADNVFKDIRKPHASLAPTTPIITLLAHTQSSSSEYNAKNSRYLFRSLGHGSSMTIILTVFKPITCTSPPMTIQNTCTRPPILKGQASDVHIIASASAKRTTHPNVDPEVFQMRHQLGARNVLIIDGFHTLLLIKQEGSFHKGTTEYDEVERPVAYARVQHDPVEILQSVKMRISKAIDKATADGYNFDNGLKDIGVTHKRETTII